MRCRGPRPCPLSPAPRRTGADRSRTTHGGSARIKEARFPAVKSLDSFDFCGDSFAKQNPRPGTRPFRVRDPPRKRDRSLGNSGTGKTAIALGIGLAARQKGLSVGFYTAVAALVHELLAGFALMRSCGCPASCAAGRRIQDPDRRRAWICPLSQTGAELLFEIFSQRYERGSTFVTSNLPFDEWTSVFGSERLTGALLDRLTHHVHILEKMNGDSYRLNQSKRRSRRNIADAPKDELATPIPDAHKTNSALEDILVGIIDAFLLRKPMQSCSGVDTAVIRASPSTVIDHQAHARRR